MGYLLSAVALALSVLAGLSLFGRRTLTNLGINWAEVGSGERLNFFVGGGLGFVGLVLAGVGVWLALEQRAGARRELERKAVLKLMVPSPPMASADGPTRYELFMLNEGNRAGTGFWYLGVPKRMRGRVSYESRPGNEQTLVAGDNWEVVGRFDQPEVHGFTDDFFLMKFVLTVALEPCVMMPCGTLLVNWRGDEAEWLGQKSVEIRDQSWRILGWFTNGPGGRFPETGMLKLRLYSRGESWFKNYHGGKELPEDDPDTFP